MATQTPEQVSVKVQESLAETPFACTSLSPLSGGTTNFLYRGTLKSPLPDSSKTIIVKHTEGYVASSPGFKITETRCVYPPSYTFFFFLKFFRGYRKVKERWTDSFPGYPGIREDHPRFTLYSSPYYT